MTTPAAPEMTPGISTPELTAMRQGAAAFLSRHGRPGMTPDSPAGFSVLSRPQGSSAAAGRSTYDKHERTHFMVMLEGPAA